MLDGKLCQEVEAAAGRCGIDVRVIEPDAAELIRDQVCEKYADGHDSWLWEHFDECIIHVDRRHWVAAGECVGEGPVLMFFNGDEDRSVISFKSGDDLAKVLGECYRFEYYVTNCGGDFLVAVDHHNVVYALGSAEESLRQIRLRSSLTK